MRRTLITVAVALAVALAGGVGGSVTAEAADQPTKVMLTGDSITHGFRGGAGGWRYWLWKEMGRTNIADRIEFVGPRDDVQGGGPYLRPFHDRDHAARAGTTVNRELTRITEQVETYQPDVVVTMLGHNDLRADRTPEHVASQMRTYLEKIRAAQPNVRIVVGEVMDSLYRNGDDRFEGRNTRLNELVAGIVRDLDTDAQPVTVADTGYSGWNPAKHTWDGTHPTPTGGTVIAQRMAWALLRPEIGVMAERPRIKSMQAWQPQPVPTINVKSPRRVIVKWYGERHRLNIWKVRVRINKAGPRGNRVTRVIGATYAVFRGLEPGATYCFRLQPIRTWMVGDFGPVVVVRMPRR